MREHDSSTGRSASEPDELIQSALHATDSQLPCRGDASVKRHERFPRVPGYAAIASSFSFLLYLRRQIPRWLRALRKHRNGTELPRGGNASLRWFPVSLR